MTQNSWVLGEKMRQKPDEPYQDFVSHLLQAISCLMVDREAEILIVMW